MSQFLGGTLVAMLLTVGGGGKAWGVPFTDVVNPAPNVFLTSSNATYTFLHDISDTGFTAAAYTITEASIALLFADDDSDGFLNLQEEHVSFRFDGTTASVQEIDTGTAHFSIATHLLQSDGKVEVHLTRIDGDVYFDKSTLTAQATPTPTPTPEPGTWVLMGSGLVGLVGYGWRRKSLQPA